MKHILNRLGCTLIGATLCAFAAQAEPIMVTASPIPAFSGEPETTTFGPLSWRGGLVLTSTSANFGGLSGLALSGTCDRLLGITDSGEWVSATLDYTQGLLTGISDVSMAPMRDLAGRALRDKRLADAEALALWTPGKLDGQVVVGFERMVRASVFDLSRGFSAGPKSGVTLPRDVDIPPDNKEMEAIARLTNGPHAGEFMAVGEENFDENGNVRAWIFGKKPAIGFRLARYKDFDITDAATLPSGDVLLLERSIGGFVPAFALAQVSASAVKQGEVLHPRLLFEARAPGFVVDNMEALAVCTADGEVRLTLGSDDNFSPLQRTLLLQFALEAPPASP